MYFFSHKDINTPSRTLNLEMTKLSDWCRANKLSINPKKCNFMIFQPRQKTHKYDLAFSKDGYPIEHVKETVFLGVVVDENLTWKPHILNVKVHWYPVQVKFLPVYSLSCLSSYFVV